ncbi:thiol-disulfide oxidoreductase DCC family protein [Virgibacillus necropolis]|uniref:thiol-disulfide oxidoreductase DCC family protein n=1 Tax=Virgibacillus necropolis TaxID=163877 RepID=UPI00384B21C7
MNNVILFDGECNFCDHSVQFIIKRDKKAIYKFASIQSDIGQKILKNFNVPENIDSLILVEGNKCYFKSSAALRICKNLKGGWKLLYCFLSIPKLVRDYFYDIIAKNRYKWFGKKDACMLPSPEMRNRFLK